jgi:ABC-2 type transport system permease protein
MATTTWPEAAAAIDDRPQHGVAALYGAARVFAWRNALAVTREPVLVVQIIIGPFLFLTVFLLTFKQLMSLRGIDYVQYLTPIITIQVLFFAGIGAAVGLASDVQSGMLDRARTMPVHHGALVAGRMAADLGRAAIGVAVLLLVAHVYGFRFEAGFWSAVAYVGLALLFAVALSSGYSAMGLALGDPETASAAALLPYAPLLLFSTGFVPEEAFPDWLGPIVAITPVSKTADALRAMANGGEVLEPLLASLAWIIGILVVCAWLGVVAYGRAGRQKKMGRRERKAIQTADHGAVPDTAAQIISSEKLSASPAALVAERREGGFARTAADTGHLARRAGRILRRKPEVLAFNLFFPITLLLFIVVSFSDVVFPGGRAEYVNFVLPLMVLQAVGFGIIGSGILMHNDIDSGMVDRFRTFPIGRSSVFLARITADSVRGLLQVFVLFLVGLLLGFSFHNGVLGAIGFFVFPLVFASWLLLIGILLAYSVDSDESVAAAIFPWMLPLTTLSTGFVPLAAFPEWLQPLVEANPFSSAAEASRAMVNGGDLMEPLLRSTFWIVALSALFGLLALRAVKRSR